MGFHGVAHKYRSFAHHLEVGPFPSDFIFPSVPGPFLRADEDLGRSMEVVDIFKYKIVKFTCVIFRVQDDGVYTLWLDDPPDSIDVYIVPLL